MALLAVAAPASAEQSPDPSAVAAYESAIERGDAAWDAGDFALARQEYKKAYAIHGDPVLQFNIASTYRRQGKLEDARRHYQAYLDAGSADTGRRRLAEETLVNIRAELELRRKQEATNSKTKPIPSPEKLVSEAPEPDAVPQVFDSAPDTSVLNQKQWTGLGVGAVGLVSLSYGIFEGSRALSRSDELSSLQATDVWDETQRAKYNEGEKFERRAIIFSVVGTAALATGATLFYLGYKEKREAEDSLAFVPVAGGGQTGAALVGRF